MKKNTECCEGGLWLTPLGRVVLDNHNCETFLKSGDKKLMTKEELKHGINLKLFIERLGI